MKAHGFVSLLGIALGLLAMVVAGCATTPKVDWNSRIGTYTFDQAVAELGPPDKQATLSDGRKVAEWITRRSGGVSFGFGTGFRRGYTGVGVGETISPTSSDRVLRLTFDSDDKLINWSRNY